MRLLNPGIVILDVGDTLTVRFTSLRSEFVITCERGGIVFETKEVTGEQAFSQQCEERVCNLPLGHAGEHRMDAGARGRCTAVNPSNIRRLCKLPAGHPGPHEDRDSYVW